MATRETLEQFARNLHKFTPLITKRILRDWQNYTEESFDSAVNGGQIPILTGTLQRSGAFLKARITPRGIESSIVFSQPYAVTMEKGETKSGKEINYRIQGQIFNVGKGSYATKQQTGRPGWLSDAIESNKPDVEQDILKSIGDAWDKI
jgi:hypothetical protein